MKKNVLYSLAALSALPMGASADVIDVSANNKPAVAATSGSDVTLSGSVFTSTNGNQMVIQVANYLVPGQYKLKIASVNTENNLSASCTVGGAPVQGVTLNALKGDGVTINVTDITESEILLTFTVDDQPKKGFTVSGVSLALSFDFDKVYQVLKGYKDELDADIEAYTLGKATEENETQLDELQETMLLWADEGSRTNQRYSAYAHADYKLYNIFSYDQTTDEYKYDYTKLTAENFGFINGYMAECGAANKAVRVAEQAARSKAAWEGFDALFDKLKENYVAAVEDDPKTTDVDESKPATGDLNRDGSPAEAGSLQKAIAAIKDQAGTNAVVGFDDLSENTTYGLEALRTQMRDLRTSVETKDKAYDATASNDKPTVQDYSTLGKFTAISTEQLETQIEYVRNNYTWWQNDLKAIDDFKEEKNTKTVLGIKDLKAGEDVSLSDYNTLYAECKKVEGYIETYETEIGTFNTEMSYKAVTDLSGVNHTKDIAAIRSSLADIIEALNTAIEAYQDLATADETAKTTVSEKVTELKDTFSEAKDVVAEYKVVDGEETIYDAADYYTDNITPAIDKLSADARAVEHATDYVAKNNAENTPKSKYMYVYDEKTYNEAWDKGYFKKYYEVNPNEDRDENDPRKHSFTAALQSAKTSNHHTWPWVVIGFDNYTGTVEFKYNDVEVFSWDVTDKVYGMVSVPLEEDMGLSEFSGWDDNGNYDSTKPATFDPSKLKITLEETGKIVAQDYHHAIDVITDEQDGLIADYKKLANDNYTTFNKVWQAYKAVEAKLPKKENVHQDYQGDWETNNGTLTSLKNEILAVTEKKDADHTTAVAALAGDTFTTKLTKLEKAIATMIALSDMQKANDYWSEQRIANKAIVDGYRNGITIQALDKAYGNESAHGTTQNGKDLIAAYGKWHQLFTSLEETYASAVTMGDEEAAGVYATLASLEGADNDYVELKRALTETVFAGYSGENQKGLINALTLHKDDVQNNESTRTSAYEELGWNTQTSKFDETIIYGDNVNSLAKEQSENVAAASDMMDAAKASNENKYGLTDAQYDSGNSLINTANGTITSQATTLKQRIDEAYANEKLYTYWNEGYNNGTEDIKAYKAQVAALKQSATALPDKAGNWIADMKNWNEVTSLKSAKLEEVATSLSGMVTKAGGAADHFKEVLTKAETGIQARIDATEIPAVPDAIITGDADRVLSDISELKATLNVFSTEIIKNEENAAVNLSWYEKIYSGANSEYNNVDEQLQALATKLELIEGDAKEDCQKEYDTQSANLLAAKTYIENHFKAGEYVTESASTEGTSQYQSDLALLKPISEALAQANDEYNDAYTSQVAIANEAEVERLTEVMNALGKRWDAANASLTTYKGYGDTIDGITGPNGELEGFTLEGRSDIVNILTSINANKDIYNEQQKEYKEGVTVIVVEEQQEVEKSLYDDDMAKIQAVEAKIDELYTKLAECNTILIDKWAALSEACTLNVAETGDKATIAKFKDNIDEQVGVLMTAAEKLLTDGNAAKTALSEAEGEAEAQDTKDKAKALYKCIGAYLDTTTGYAAKVDEAKWRAAKSDITNKKDNFISANVTATKEAIEEGTYKNGKVVELDDARKQELRNLYNTAYNSSVKVLVDEIDDVSPDAEFATEYDRLKNIYDGLTNPASEYYYSLETVNAKIGEYIQADADLADVKAMVKTYVEIETVDNVVTLKEDSEAKLNKRYFADKQKVAGTKAENVETVVDAFDALKENIIDFNEPTQYADEAAVETAYTAATTGEQAWIDGAINAAVNAEKGIIANEIVKLEGLYEKYETVATIAEATTMKANIDKLSSTESDFTKLAAQEALILQYTTTMVEKIESINANTILVDFQTRAKNLAIDDAVTTFVTNVFGESWGTDSYAVAIKNATTSINDEYTQLAADIKAIKSDLDATNGKYTAENILYYQDVVESALKDAEDGRVDLKKLVTETVNNTLNKTPEKALDSYNKRKTLNDTYYGELATLISTISGEIDAANDEEFTYATLNLSTAENDFGTKRDAVNTANANLDLVEVDDLADSGYKNIETFRTNLESVQTAVATAVQTARRNEIGNANGGMIKALELETIAARVEAAVTAKGVTGSNLTTVTSLKEQYANQYANLKTTIASDTDLEHAEYHEDLNGIAENVTELLTAINNGDYSVVVGDITGTGKVDGNDFNTLRDLILSKTVLSDSTTPTLEQCDLNGDQELSIGDLVMLNNILLGRNPDGTAKAARAWFGSSESVTTETIVTGENTRRIAVNLTNNREYAAFQMDIVLPEGMTLVGESLTDRARMHRLASRDLEDGTHRIITVPLLNTLFKGNEGAVLYLDVQTTESYLGGDVVLQDVVFTNQVGTDTRFNVSSETTGIIDSLKGAAQTAKDAIYDLGGKMKNGLKKGINIIRRNDGSTQKVVK